MQAMRMAIDAALPYIAGTVASLLVSPAQAQPIIIMLPEATAQCHPACNYTTTIPLKA